MHREHGTTSPWMAALPAAAGALDGDGAADVIVVGAGIAGMSIAYELATLGQRVMVLEAATVGGGETGRTTAHLTTALDGRYYKLERLVGQEGAALCAASHACAISRIESICGCESIACDFQRVDGFLVVPPEDGVRAMELLETERLAAQRVGVASELVRRAPFASFDSGPCLRFPGQAQFHVGKYLSGLVSAILERGGRIHTGTRVVHVHDGEAPSVTTDRGYAVSARAVVVATNSPVNDRVVMHTKQTPYRSYVIGVRALRGILPPALIWDGFWDDHSKPYHYVRLRMDPTQEEELLVVGGEDHVTGRDDDADGRYAALEAWTRERFPNALDVAYRWSGQIMEPHDEVAFIGRNPGSKHVYVVTGDSGNGMTHGAIAGMLIPCLLRGEDHPWKHVYSPSRLPQHAVGHAVVENAHVVAQYRDWVAPRDHTPLERLAPGAGTVVRDRLGRLRAVYKDLNSVLHWTSAVCPHLQGIVRWNAGECSWDCPCHGSRFDCRGNVLHGPANEPLAPVQEDGPHGMAAPSDGAAVTGG